MFLLAFTAPRFRLPDLLPQRGSEDDATLGVGVATINRDLNPVPDGTKELDSMPTEQSVTAPSVPSGTPAPNLDGLGKLLRAHLREFGDPCALLLGETEFGELGNLGNRRFRFRTACFPAAGSSSGELTPRPLRLPDLLPPRLFLDVHSYHLPPVRASWGHLDGADVDLFAVVFPRF